MVCRLDDLISRFFDKNQCITVFSAGQALLAQGVRSRRMSPFFATWLLVFATVFVAGSPGRAQSPPVVLEHHRAEMVEVDTGGERYWFDRSIGPQEALRILRYRQAVAGAEWRNPRIYAVPGRADRFVVSDNEPPDGEHFGLRLYLIARAADGFAQLSKTSGAGDSYNLTPTFLTGAGRTIILLAWES